ncbi:hypothetical protein D046_6803B, partial [Vibrio parahaemolyticus V-223/04]
GGWVSS